MVATLDIDGDVLPDILVLDRSKSQFEILQNGADGGPGLFKANDGLATVIALDAPATGVSVYDMDQDGATDVLMSLESKGTVMLYFNRAGSVPPNQPVRTCSSPRVAAGGDVDADGIRELIVACTAEQQLQILHRQQDGTYVEQLRVAMPSGIGNVLGIAPVDFDGDGLNDIVISGSSAIGLVRNQSH